MLITRALYVRGSQVAYVLFLGLCLNVLPCGAQSTGTVKGKVVNAQGLAVEGARVVLEMSNTENSHLETTTNKDGEFVQTHLAAGAYRITAGLENVGTQSFEIRVHPGLSTDVRFHLGPGSYGATLSEEGVTSKGVAVDLFEEGVVLNRDGRLDEAIAKFTEVADLVADCSDCYYNIGHAYVQKKLYKEAEASFKRTLAIDPYYADAYNGLATIYNAQRRFDDAAAASAEAAKRAAGTTAADDVRRRVDAIYNQGVILWNAGRVAQAEEQFDEVLKIDRNHSESHYWLGMINLNKGKTPQALVEFATYVQLAPDGQYAAQAKAALAQVKK